MRRASVCRVGVDGSGPRLKSCMTPAELHCKFQKSVIPPEYSSTDSDSRGAISVHSGLKQTYFAF